MAILSSPKCLLLLLIFVNSIFGFTNVYPKLREYKFSGDFGDPLFVTPLIESGKIGEAQNLSKVTNGAFLGIENYSGYFTVNKKYNSNMFFWFFPAQNNFENAPTVLWLQGGPGATSLFGLFMEHGPFYVTSDINLKKREYSWNLYHNVLYIDNPVGTGYSFTENPEGYSKSEEDVGQNLYEALKQFFQLFPQLQKNDFFVTGESYAGKYVPTISYFIHKNNQKSNFKINLKGLAIGNGLSDPKNQLVYGDYLYQLGLIDFNGQKKFHEYEKQGVDYINEEKWLEAFKIFDSLLNGDFNGHKSIFKNLTAFDNYFNYLIDIDRSQDEVYMSKFIQKTEIRKAIHVGNLTFHTDQNVETNLQSDIMQSVTSYLSVLTDHYRVLIYNGQLDIIVAYPLTVNYLKQLKFDSSDKYLTAKRHFWHVDNELAGYVKVAGNLTEVLVRNAGHMVPQDQPKWGLDLITRFTHDKSFFPKNSE